MDGISGAASVLALVELAGKTIAYVKQVKDAPQDKQHLLKLLIQSKGILYTLNDLIEFVENEEWASTIRSLSDPAGALAQYQKILERIISRLNINNKANNLQHSFNRLKWPFVQREIKKMTSELEKLKSTFIIATANDHVRLSMETRNEVQRTNLQIIDIKAMLATRLASLSPRQRVMVESLSTFELSVKLDESRIQALALSGEWLLEQETFKSWENGDTSCHALALIAEPKTDISMLCEIIPYYLELWLENQPNTCLVYLSLRSQRLSRRDKASILSAIVSQMLNACPHLIHHLQALRRRHGTLPFEVSVQLLQTAREDLDRFYIIIDGLDEAEDAEICAVLDGLLYIHPPPSLLVAARPVGYLDDRITCRIRPPTADILHQDLIRYIRCEIQQRHSLVRFLDGDADKITEAVNKIAEQSSQLFEFAKWYIEWLATAENSVTFHRMLRCKLHSVHQFHTLTLENILQQNPDKISIAKAFFKTVSKQRGGYKLEDIRDVMINQIAPATVSMGYSRNPSNEELIEIATSCCKGMLSYDSTTNRIAIPDASTLDFLVARNFKGLCQW